MRYARYAWLAAAFGILVYALVVFDSAENRDVDIVLAWVMMTLSFPGSLLCAIAYGGILAALDVLFGIEIGATRAVMAATWVGLFAVGYFQWFYLLPQLWRRLVKIRADRSTRRSGLS